MTNTATAILAGGCFWGMQDLIRKQPGVLSTRVGYTGGRNDHPTYRNHPGHAEAIEIVYDPTQTDFRALLEFFFQIHDPSTKDRQGNDVGTQYRSAIYTFSPEQQAAAEASRQAYEGRLAAAGLGKITTEIRDAPPFYFAEGYHQQYLAKNPNGYCGLGGTGVTCPMPATVAAA